MLLISIWVVGYIVTMVLFSYYYKKCLDDKDNKIALTWPFALLRFLTKSLVYKLSLFFVKKNVHLSIGDIISLQNSLNISSKILFTIQQIDYVSQEVTVKNINDPSMIRTVSWDHIKVEKKR